MERNSINSIFIATSSFEQSTWEPVATHLHERGYETVIYEADKVANGMKDFNNLTVCRISNLNSRCSTLSFDPSNERHVLCYMLVR